MSIKKEQLEAVLMPLEQYLRRNICLDEGSPFYGGLLETVPHTPNPVWSHTSYATADAYLRLYESYKEVSFWQMTTVMIEFLVREQTEAGCWFGYTGYHKDAGWTEENAPPGSKLNLRMEDGTILDIIRSPFSMFGTALYSKVVANALPIAEKIDPQKAMSWRSSFIMAAEFLRCMIDEDGYWVQNRAWNQRAAVAVTLFTAASLLGPDRYLKKAQVILDQILQAQLDSGEYPYDNGQGRTYHYHALTLCLLNQIQELAPDERVERSVHRGLDWMWGMQKADGDLDWTIHAPDDHKTRMPATFGFALRATAPYLSIYEEQVHKTLRFLQQHQNPDGGFPWKIGLKSSDTAASGETFLGLAELTS
ncbi:hypothetical protein DRQ00_08870 [candidate division KSB1 bacterium]|nr:MAG: hypothetical protein DRQ00_08870 [candidate division KSB1 bacterium]